MAKCERCGLDLMIGEGAYGTVLDFDTPDGDWVVCTEDLCALCWERMLDEDYRTRIRVRREALFTIPAAWRYRDA